MPQAGNSIRMGCIRACSFQPMPEKVVRLLTQYLRSETMVGARCHSGVISTSRVVRLARAIALRLLDFATEVLEAVSPVNRRDPSLRPRVELGPPQADGLNR